MSDNSFERATVDLLRGVSSISELSQNEIDLTIQTYEELLESEKLIKAHMAIAELEELRLVPNKAKISFHREEFKMKKGNTFKGLDFYIQEYKGKIEDNHTKEDGLEIKAPKFDSPRFESPKCDAPFGELILALEKNNIDLFNTSLVIASLEDANIIYDDRLHLIMFAFFNMSHKREESPLLEMINREIKTGREFSPSFKAQLLTKEHRTKAIEYITGVIRLKNKELENL